MLKNIKTGNLNTMVQEQIKIFIVESGLKAGDILPTEKKLEEQLGISRASIREALRSLEAIGILETRHGIGRFLREFNYDAILETLSYNIEVNIKDFREIIDVRIALESSFLENNIHRFSEQDIKDLYTLLDNIENEVKRQHQDQYEEKELIKIHTAFHLKLYEHEDNSFLLHLISIFATMQKTLNVLKRYRTSDRSEFILLHRRLIQAIEKEDPALARQRLQEHFKDVITWSDENR